ncbi:hypothetical protein POJ06DRAFT_277401 [Lipomyces tetrasporus]|uniref:Uncharacterized protein n=1 Tax=Lipomyces tetrasporus TaxID=54092 RepID=A0AAD7QN69_9ASCO|nr:uncharacterized protein POJ06DRAFT_277401 [Lipomyces tetrasporus]KAJ8098133.1 hypothetical protein POJ06DRAFT_277401 [Lipomyces tetrasporus]
MHECGKYDVQRRPDATFNDGYLDSFAELHYLQALDAAVPRDDGIAISLRYRVFCKPTFYSYKKWKHVPVGIQIRMCEYLELEFPLLSLAEGQWAAVVFLSGYFRRAHGCISSSRLSADYQVRVVDEDSDEYVAEETLQDTQSEADGEITRSPMFRKEGMAALKMSHNQSEFRPQAAGNLIGLSLPR